MAIDYIYTPAFDSGGLLWPLIFDRLMVGVFLAQFIVVAVLGVKQGTIAVRPSLPCSHSRGLICLHAGTSDVPSADNYLGLLGPH